MTDSIVDPRDFTGWTLPNWARALTPRIAGHLLDPMSADSIELASGDGHVEIIAAPRVLGFRLFGLDSDGVLSSIGVGGTWDSRTMQAECHGGSCDGTRSPAPHCSCGLYGFYNVAQAIQQNRADYGGYTYAACAYTGRIIGHQFGIRAEFSEIVGLALPHPTGYISSHQAAADRYGLASGAVHLTPQSLAVWAESLPGWIKVQ
jgi:hypothetical protein